MRSGELIKILCTWNILLIISSSKAQCPENIGFESGSFKNWVISKGSLSQIFNAPITTDPVDSFYRVSLLKNGYPQEFDPFGQFPINAPNSSNYSIKLGDSVGYGLVQRVSYTFTIPANQNNYNLVYNYAVVLQEPGHAAWAQPSFTAKVFDVTADRYIDCGSFNFVASSKLPGFLKSAFGTDVYYKNWAPSSIKLVGYAGKTVRIEFTTHDCAFGPHFAYAYIDVNENCSSSVTGNVFCINSNSVSLIAPPGFSGYQWYDDNYSHLLDSSNILKLKTTPIPGTVYHVIITPYPDLGCLDTIHTTIESTAQNFKLQTVDSIKACSSNLVDLTAAFITAGSTADLNLSYFRNSSLTEYEPTPKHINHTGTYYIKADNSAGCSDTKPISVHIFKNPVLSINNQSDCGFVNINSPIGFSSDQTGVITDFWKDSAATIVLANPDSVTASGTYYIRAINSFGCSTTEAIKTTVFSIPYFTVAQSPAVFLPMTIDLTTLAKSSTNTPSNFSYWQDRGATISVLNPKTVGSSGMYYIKSVSTDGCAVLDSVALSILKLAIVPPNVFSPNKDGINDTWEIPSLHNFPDCVVEVYNRTGQLVFFSKGYQINWDGTFNHQALPIGAYYFIIKATPNANPISGSVLIIR